MSPPAGKGVEESWRSRSRSSSRNTLNILWTDCIAEEKCFHQSAGQGRCLLQPVASYSWLVTPDEHIQYFMPIFSSISYIKPELSIVCQCIQYNTYFRANSQIIRHAFSQVCYTLSATRLEIDFEIQGPSIEGRCVRLKTNIFSNCFNFWFP